MMSTNRAPEAEREAIPLVTEDDLDAPRPWGSSRGWKCRDKQCIGNVDVHEGFRPDREKPAQESLLALFL